MNGSFVVALLSAAPPNEFPGWCWEEKTCIRLVFFYVERGQTKEKGNTNITATTTDTLKNLFLLNIFLFLSRVIYDNFFQCKLISIDHLGRLKNDENLIEIWYEVWQAFWKTASSFRVHTEIYYVFSSDNAPLQSSVTCDWNSDTNDEFFIHPFPQKQSSCFVNPRLSFITFYILYHATIHTFKLRTPGF